MKPFSSVQKKVFTAYLGTRSLARSKATKTGIKKTNVQKVRKDLFKVNKSIQIH